MLHKAINLTFGEGTLLYITFSDGTTKEFDVSSLFSKYPIMKALKERNLFLHGHLAGQYGIIWNEDIDLEAETIYMNGRTINKSAAVPHSEIGDAVYAARAQKNISQIKLAALCGIDQSDISKIERGVSNPTVDTLERIASALDMKLRITFE